MAVETKQQALDLVASVFVRVERRMAAEGPVIPESPVVTEATAVLDEYRRSIDVIGADLEATLADLKAVKR